MIRLVNIADPDEATAKLGWNYDFELLQKVKNEATKATGEQTSLEIVQAIIDSVMARKVEELHCPACGSKLV